MLQALWNQLQTLLGLELDISDVNALQMAFRTILIYAFTLAIIRLGSKRFLSKASAFALAVGIAVQGAGVGQSVKNPDESRINPSRDLVAQGAANVASGLLSGIPAGGST